MAEHPHVPSEVTEAVLRAAPMIERFYVEGGGNPRDLRTDLSHGLAAVILPSPRIEVPGYSGPDRRQHRIDLDGVSSRNGRPQGAPSTA